mgnify:CR=1 FL=1
MAKVLEINDPKLFAKIAGKNGLLTKEQFQQALDAQAAGGGSKNLARVLVDENLMTPRDIDKVLVAVERYARKGTTIQPKTASQRVTALTGRLVRFLGGKPQEPDLSTDIEDSAVDLPAAAPARDASAAHRALLEKAVSIGASDVHFQSGACPYMRKDGRLMPLSDQIATAEWNEQGLLGFVSDELQAVFAEKQAIDFALALPGLARFRVSYSRQIEGVDGAFRIVGDKIPSLQQLGLPAELSILTNYHQGLILVTGPAGCGKSTTMAALVNLMNQQKKLHILTIEDPIESIYPTGRCLVNQREAGRDTASFARALRAALREDPDIIVIGELRDRETVGLALSAAETGHLVLGTLHTRNAIRTIDRLVDVFPADKQPQVRSMLSESLRGVVSQVLLPRSDGKGRIPAIEVLLVTPAIANLVRDNRTHQVRSSMQTGRKQGMRLLDDSLKALVEAGTVSLQEAAAVSESPASLGGGG